MLLTGFKHRTSDFGNNRVTAHAQTSSLQGDLPMFNVTSKKSPNVYKSRPKIISLEKLKILTHLQKLPKNLGDLDKLIFAKGFEKLPKVQ